jgi:hypothetical protein
MDATQRAGYLAASTEEKHAGILNELETNPLFEQANINRLFIGEMMKPSWSTYFNLFDKQVGNRVRDLLAEEKMMSCLVKARVIDTMKKEAAPGEPNAEALAAATAPDAVLAKAVEEMERIGKIPDTQSFEIFQIFYQAGVDDGNKCVFDDLSVLTPRVKYLMS